ncbi:MAG: sterol desaturase family protein [Parvibaculum sp.]|uniref:sterol desaturase family protein n=1 Tax=Parvibaculum sp. TaxID=2024848 RepID=UPI0025CF3F90|nr:sterol desaturase family protein [Parvibaculum sp.]MCE9648292.1 sterol desaturase family protein [Parvibaculum sp.]
MRRLLSYILWPVIFVASLGATWAGMESGHGVAAFNVIYLLLALTIALIERVMPHERAWLENDGQMPADLAHTILNKGFAQVLITFIIFMGIADWLAPVDNSFWPEQWPLGVQLALGLVIAEFGLYWKHRLAHEWPWLWRFHAVHHSVTRLWFFNTGRFHLVDTVTGLAVGIPVLLILGAPQNVLLLVSATTAIIGMLTHCNIEMRCGVLNYVFNTPCLHRWHHSKVLAEGNRNYGENLMIFDQLFGTFYNSQRRPPADIGIAHPMPATFLGQLKAPFTSQPL